MSSRLASPDESPARRVVERLDARADAAMRRATGSARANPLLHAGTISVFLLVVVVLSGVYITLFFEFGFVESFESVQRLTDHPVQRVVRSVHRYSSAALVATTAVHAWRTFVAGRFTAGRRFRWLTGVAALGLVWLAGVTGYALVGDQRAQAIGGAVANLIERTGWGASRVGQAMLDSAEGTGGSGLFLFVWFLHLGLTAVIGWAIWRHLRRSRQAIVPPRHWMVAMAVGLLALSLIVPADLLGRADPARLLPDMSLDPFMLFLLPPLRSAAGELVLAAMVLLGGAVAAIPWVLRDRPGIVVAIDEAACTGCDLCVVDCPYLALEMVENADGRSVARLDPAACVACGICLGSCSFGAISMPGQPEPAAVDCAGRAVVVTCRRQARHTGGGGPEGVIVEVECTGAMHPSAVHELTTRGAVSVDVVGCAPGECGYGIGNRLTHERLQGQRAPHVARRDLGLATETYVELGALRGAQLPAAAPDPDASELPGSRRARLVGAAVVAVSLLLVGAATLLPFGGDGERAGVRVVVSHRPGAQLEGQDGASGAGADLAEVSISVDGAEVRRAGLAEWDGVATGAVDATLEPGRHDIEVVLIEGDDRSVLFDDAVELVAGQRLLVPAVDVPPPPGVAAGRTVFTEARIGGCTICHSTDRGVDDVGPSLYGVADRAGSTVEGMTAAEYLRESIVDPDAHVVEGWPAGQMLPVYGERLTEYQIDSLVEYLLTLEGSS
ncbi:MAG: cytochrome b N-terminal domain-containing protein [Acidimicrobiales bacterium]